MSAKAYAAVVVVLMALAPVAAAQPGQQPDIPVRLTWSALNQDGYAMVTFTNDTPLVVTAWALSTNITRTDGSKTVLPSNKMDTWASLVAARTGLIPAVGPPLLSPATPYTHAVKVGLGPPADIAEFSLFLTAVVFEDGTVTGNRAQVAMLLASREVEAATADAWRTVFQSAADAADRDTAVLLLQEAIDGGAPAIRVGASLKGLAQQVIRDRADESRFNTALDRALQRAHAYATEGRRHLNPGRVP